MKPLNAKLGLAAIAVVAAATLSGCSGATVTLTPAAHDATNAKCASVVVQLPTSVSTLSERVTDTQGTGAWGTPADILLRCGVPVPDPTSALPCITVNGIDWLRNDKKAPVYVFTTYGRDPAVAVTVNSKDVKADGNKALTDLALAVGQIPAKHRCIAVEGILQDGDPVPVPTKTPTPTPTPTPTNKP
jgi:Protein of unknown function (DUF3515)